MELLAVIVSLLLTLLAVIVGMAKVQRLPASSTIRDTARISPVLWTVTGWVELVAAGFLVVGIFANHATAIVAASVLGLSYLVLVVRQVAARQPLATVTPAIVLTALALLSVAAIVAADR